MAINERPPITRCISIPRQAGKTWAEKQWLEIDHKEGTVIIEIAEKDFREIQDRLGKIRATAISVKMMTHEDAMRRVDFIATQANEITALLNKGHLTPKAETTKFIERYSTWICEKCGYELESNILPPGWEKKEFEPTCPGCYRKIVEMVPLVREGG